MICAALRKISRRSVGLVCAHPANAACAASAAATASFLLADAQCQICSPVAGFETGKVLKVETDLLLMTRGTMGNWWFACSAAIIVIAMVLRQLDAGKVPRVAAPVFRYTRIYILVRLSKRAVGFWTN